MHYNYLGEVFGLAYTFHGSALVQRRGVSNCQHTDQLSVYFIPPLQEQLLLEPMFIVPGSQIKTVNIEEDTVRHKQQPRYEYHEEEGRGSSGERDEGEDSSSSDSNRQEEVGVALEQSTAAKAKI